MNEIELDLGEVSIPEAGGYANAFSPQKPEVAKVLMYQENCLETNGNYWLGEINLKALEDAILLFRNSSIVLPPEDLIV